MSITPFTFYREKVIVAYEKARMVDFPEFPEYSDVPLFDDKVKFGFDHHDRVSDVVDVILAGLVVDGFLKEFA